MSDLIERIKAVAGKDFNSYDCRVRNPHITARQSIEIADYIVALERERNELAAQVERLQLAILNAIPFVPGGSVKAGLRDAYDETPPAALASLKEQWNCPTVENGKNR